MKANIKKVFVAFTDWLETSETARRLLVLARYLPVMLALVVIPAIAMDLVPRVHRNYFQGPTIVFENLPWPTAAENGAPKNSYRPGDVVYARVQFRTTAYGQANTQVRLERVDDASYQPVGYPPVWLAIGNTSAVARLIELPSNLEPGQYVLRGHLQYVTSLRHYEADWLTKEFTVEAR